MPKLHGVSVPAFCYGTAWKEERSERLTRLAIDQGFRAIDTANQRKHYDEVGVGNGIASALRDGVVKRHELFLQTKFTYARGQDHRLPYDPEATLTAQVEQSFASSLAHLHTDHLDAYILHGPASSHGLADADIEVWRAMEALHRTGKIKLLGVSNVTIEQLQQLRSLARVPIAFVQNRCYARDGWDAEVRAFCREHGAVYQGFSLLTANKSELQRPLIDEIAMRLGCTREQVVFRFAIQIGMLPLTGTSSAAHMAEDLAAEHLVLTGADLLAIETIAQ
ncbi:MAG: aldo/keto reductase [Deltaproteobacteria bacterium]|nr:aldo/keto reductase [Deltaproteobacteria bacterium]MDQ3296273.1 aldo/keto reductase [Myxococcota bacterium]